MYYSSSAKKVFHANGVREPNFLMQVKKIREFANWATTISLRCALPICHWLHWANRRFAHFPPLSLSTYTLSVGLEAGGTQTQHIVWRARAWQPSPQYRPTSFPPPPRPPPQLQTPVLRPACYAMTPSWQMPAPSTDACAKAEWPDPTSLTPRRR